MADRMKRETRARMAHTDERYTTARQHVLNSHQHESGADRPRDVAVARAVGRDEIDDLSDEELAARFNDYLDAEGNPWRLNLDEFLLELEDGTYEVALDDCRTSAEVLDWITQIAAKSWGTDAIVAGLVRALEVLIEPQTHLCSDGEEGGPVVWDPEDIVNNIRWSGIL